MTDWSTSLRNQVDRSGYPFNMAVAEVIRRSHERQRWRVEAEEIPWSMMKQSGFIDVAIARDRAIGIIECKKVNNEDRLVFLIRPGQDIGESRCRLEIYIQDLPETAIELPLRLEPRFFVAECNMKSNSPESSYCVASKGGNSANLNLDDIASDLLESCEGLLGNWKFTLPEKITACIPIIVTNAQLYTCAFDPGQIDLGSADLPDNASFKPQPFVRFRKAFRHSGGQFAVDTKKTLEQVVEEGERTVFVVDARELVKFLALLRGLTCPNPGGDSPHRLVSSE